jgi:hypothetical protein
MSILILTDIPEWVRPLVDLLEPRGIKVQVADDPEEIVANGLIVNLVSSLLAERDKARADRITHSLRTWEAEGRSVINGSLCFQTGYSKLAQAKLFTECGVLTPLTYPAVPGGRAIHGQAVLLLPRRWPSQSKEFYGPQGWSSAQSSTFWMKRTIPFSST